MNINIPLIALALLTGFVSGYCLGKSDGINQTLYRDHVQATAGVFIDGYDKNKIYRLPSKPTLND